MASKPDAIPSASTPLAIALERSTHRSVRGNRKNRKIKI